MSKLSRARVQRDRLSGSNAQARPLENVLLLAFSLLLASCVTGEPSITTDAIDSKQSKTSPDADQTAEDAQEAIASAVPDTDIFVFHIDPDTAEIVTGFQANVTQRAGYDNQPKYLPGGNSFLFSSILDGRQSDVYRYDDAREQLVQVTSTAVSEYSPTPRPDGSFSAVVVEEDGTQRLWTYTGGGEGANAIRGDVTGIGYHAWLDEQLAVFIVSEPLMHLDVIGASDTSRYTLAVNPGRSLHALPDGNGFSFVQHLENESSRLNSWDGERIQWLANMPEGVEDMTWLPDGRALTVSNGHLMVWSDDARSWRQAADLSTWLPGEVTRLAINDAATRLAIVSQMSKAETE